MILAILLATAQAMTATVAPAPVAAPAAPDRKMCRYEKETGSMMPGKRICHLRTEWVAIDSVNQRRTENFRRGGEGGALRQE